MRSRILPALGTVLLALALAAPAGAAVPIDGRLDPDYGVALSTQTTQTYFGDGNWGMVGESFGSELDAAHGYIADGVLHLFIAGNLTFFWGVEISYYYALLELFIDSTPGGQNTLGSANPVFAYGNDMNAMAGLTFDPGFAPDYWLGCGGGYTTLPLQVYYAELPAAGGGAGAYLGTSTPGGSGTLVGGSNPHGILATLDDSNTGGVTAGCGAASGAGVTRGVEYAIPLSAIGNPTGCVRVSAFVAGGGHGTVSNQVLGPLPPGTCNPGTTGLVDFGAYAGDQFFEVCPAIATPAPSGTWGSLKIRYR
jgi:hypothetical protein